MADSSVSNTAGAGQKALIALSGSVQSAVAGAILKNQGFEVEAIHFNLGDRKPFEAHFLSDLELARSHAKLLDVPLHEIDASGAFEDVIMDYVVHCMLQQQWPDIITRFHQELVLKSLFTIAEQSGCPFVATAHHAQILQESSTGICRIVRSSSAEDDQSFYFFSLSQEQLKRLVLPLGAFSEAMTLRLANELKLETKKTQTAEAFRPTASLIRFVESRIPESLRSRGPIRTLENQLVSEHSGLYQFWVGKPTQYNDPLSKQPNVVLAFDPMAYAVVIGSPIHLQRKEIQVGQVNWLRPMDELHGLKTSAKLDPKSPPVRCRVTHFENRTVRVEFAEAQKFVAPGQAIAFFEGSEVLGGGTVELLL